MADGSFSQPLAAAPQKNSTRKEKFKKLFRNQLDEARITLEFDFGNFLKLIIKLNPSAFQRAHPQANPLSTRPYKFSQIKIIHLSMVEVRGKNILLGLIWHQIF